MQIKNGNFWLGNCLELMRDVPDNSVDMILCDLPYGTTQNKWDTVIPFEPLWAEYWRVCKPNAAIVLTASQPFTTALIHSQIDCFKYEWIWEKNKPSGHVHAKNKPMKKHENVCVFSKGVTIHKSQSDKRMPYNPQDLIIMDKMKKRKGGASKTVMGARPSHKPTETNTTGYPHSLLSFNGVHKPDHPTQKPVALFEYLIKTYTNEGETVLDNCAGSGTTAIAAENTNRKWICIEQEPEYYNKACFRVMLNDHA